MSWSRRTKTTTTKVTKHEYSNNNFKTTDANTLEDIFAITRIIAFETYNFICRKQRKNERLEQFNADLVQLVSQAVCGDPENDWVWYMLTAHMSNDKIAEELLAETKSKQDTYAIMREKVIEDSKAMKTNPFGVQTTTNS